MTRIMETPDCNWKQGTIERVALEVIKEQKLKRRWGIFFKTFFLICLTFIIGYLVFEANKTPNYDVFGRRMNDLSKGRIALVRLSGEISPYRIANSETLSKLLRQAISDKDVKGLLLLANSPGGSPVQSSEVYQTIRALKKQYQKPILTVVADRCASGCYYIASATDEIYADKSSVVGSIGVILDGYGYSEAAEKLGIELRTFTAGENKDILNPARPLTAKDVAFVKSWLDNTHQNFITAVKEGRGKATLGQSGSVFRLVLGGR